MAAAFGRSDVNLGDADFILGTSAGASVGALIALGRDLDPVFDRYRPRERPDGTVVEEGEEDAREAPGPLGASGPMARAQRVMTDALGVGVDDVYDVWRSEPLFYPAKPPAHCADGRRGVGQGARGADRSS